MDTIAYHQKLAALANERGDHLSAARHYQDAANCYRSWKKGSCLRVAEQELHLGLSSFRGEPKVCAN